MTVDESPTSPSHHNASKPKAVPVDTNIASLNQSSGQGSSRVSNMASPQPRGQVQSPGKRAPASVPHPTFQMYQEKEPVKAKQMLDQLSEISGGITDKTMLHNALNQARYVQKDGSVNFNMSNAVEWLLDSKNIVSSVTVYHPHHKSTRRVLQQEGIGHSSPGHGHRNVGELDRSTEAAPAQRPNSPANEAASKQALVDLTGSTTPNNKEQSSSADADLEKAIQLSLQEANRTTAFGGGHMSQEDQDVSRALEASLLDSQLGSGKRKRGDNWIDPLNPHDRERNGLWPVGLKNVGQTCWFSAVIQSLFYLPAFRSLVLNYKPPILERRKKTEASALGNSNYDSDRQRKIVEFMQELRKLFSLMVATRRKYVDPSRAVDILRGSIGNNVGVVSGPLTESENDSNLNNSAVILDNNQQDVSEFTHIVLEWVEEAFKLTELNNKDKEEQLMDQGVSNTANDEKENNEEKATADDEDISERNEAEKLGERSKINPMSKLFYGQVLIEGIFQGDPFVRTEAFGQWPLQVNHYRDIHESIEGSTAHEFFDANSSSTSLTSTPLNSQQQAGQERWFDQLPPVLFLELSRFHYNTERKVAEKIHNRLEFPEVIYMDRYMKENKNITREKREEVRILKERRAQLTSRLNMFTNYNQRGGDSDKNTKDNASSTKGVIPLPDVLQLAIDFASSSNSEESLSAIPSHLKDEAMHSPSDVSSSPGGSGNQQQEPMVVDSPCHSPRVTPASSLVNITNPSSHVDENADVPMDVEMSEAAGAEKPENEIGIKNDCQPCDKTTSSLFDTNEIVSQQPPCPRHVSHHELRVLQTCLLRWKQEVSEDMATLETAINDVDVKINNMYLQQNLKQLEYRLHAVMVHEGGVDSGHYWAYVRDHKRKVWLKFNDNTVNEASWEELLKESIGGRSNTSAYSLVYIDTSKPELLLLDSIGATAIGETSGDRMEEGEIEALALTLPQDLAVHVSADNIAFHEEIQRWDLEQEDRKKQEASLRKQQEAEMSAQAGADVNDIQVVHQKLTHVNTHAKLNIEFTLKMIKSVEGVMKTESVDRAVHQAMARTLLHYRHHISNQQQLLQHCQATFPELPSSDPRLESFLSYLIVNKVDNQATLDLAVLEQFSPPGTPETNDKMALKFRECAEQILNNRRLQYQEAVMAVKLWHQAYHWYRRCAHFFVAGIESYLSRKYDESLDQFTEAYIFNEKLNEADLPQAPCKGFSSDMIARFLCLVLHDVNNRLIKQFQAGTNLDEVTNTVKILLVPVLEILQMRCAKGDGSVSNESRSLEEVRGEWCALLAESEGSAITGILTMVLDNQDSNLDANDKKREFVDQQADLRLPLRFIDAVQNFRDKMENKNQVAASVKNPNQAPQEPRPSGDAVNL